MTDPAASRAVQRFLSGLVGRDILKSRSPWLHEQEADAQGVRLIYTPFDFAWRGWGEEQLGPLLDAARTIGMAGFNVTFPYKQAILPLLDGLSDGAARIGSVNTVALRHGRAIGHNTDAVGFAEGMRSALPGAAMRRVVQMGAGGAGFATAYALLGLGAERLTVFDTEPARAAALAERLNATFGDGRVAGGSDLANAMATADGLVNATPLGMARYPGTSVPVALLRPELWVSDIVYFPLETELLRAARARGCRTLDGSLMVVFQAAAAFDIITGLAADRERMLASFYASPAHSQGGGVIALGHVNIRTERMEETLAWYETVLGFRRGAALTNPDPAQNVWLFDEAGAPSIHVNAFKPGEQAVVGSTLHHVAFNCPDRVAMAERLRAAGIAYVETPTRVPGLVQFNLTDPNGVRVELTFGHELTARETR